jgi:hypothetical protein
VVTEASLLQIDIRSISSKENKVMLEPKGVWAVEWDPESKTPHIQLLKETLDLNLRCIANYEKKRFIPKYLLVGLAENMDVANEMCNQLDKEFGEPV